MQRVSIILVVFCGRTTAWRAVSLDSVNQKNLDIIFSDIEMPVMGGFQLLAELKLDVHLRDLPVIMASALDETGWPGELPRNRPWPNQSTRCCSEQAATPAWKRSDCAKNRLCLLLESAKPIYINILTLSFFAFLLKYNSFILIYTKKLPHSTPVLEVVFYFSPH